MIGVAEFSAEGHMTARQPRVARLWSDSPNCRHATRRRTRTQRVASRHRNRYHRKRSGQRCMAHVFLRERCTSRSLLVKSCTAPRADRNARTYRREAEAAARLVHPLWPISEWARRAISNTWYEYYAGGSLADLRPRSARVACRAASTAVQVSCALDYAHRRAL